MSQSPSPTAIRSGRGTSASVAPGTTIAPPVDHRRNHPSLGDGRPHGLSWRALARNGFVLLIPVMVWDSVFAGFLPAVYRNTVAFGAAHPHLALGEAVFRWLVVLLPIVMPISLATRRQRIGFVLWFAGTAAYFASWVAVIAWPASAWSGSAVGFLAPAYLAYPWLIGIGMMTDRLYVRSPYRWWQYIVASSAFVTFHTTHFVTIWPG